MRDMTLLLKVPPNIGPKLERQIMEYVQLREIGEELRHRGFLDPTKLC